jgi:hypothetical protein
MHGSQVFKFQRTRTRFPRQLPPVPTDTFMNLPLSLWATLWARRSSKRVVGGFAALRLVKTFANDA